MKKIQDIEIGEDSIFKNDLLNRETEIKNLTPIITNFEDTLVLTLDAPWGSGKTTFIKLWRSYLKKNGIDSIFFNAWETDYAEDPLVVLISELNKWIIDNGNESIANEILSKSKKVLLSIAKQTAIAAVKIGTLNSVDGEQLDRVVSDATGAITGDLIENFNKQSEAIKLFKEDIIPKIIKTLPSEQKNLIIFIDELDRCRPTYAIELLERIKHLFNIPRIVFILATDTTQLSHSIQAIYGNNFDANKYLQRFIDMDYSLKNPEQEKYIRLKIESLDIKNELLQRTTGSQNNVFDDFFECFTFFVHKFDLKLRDINILLMRIRLILYSIPKNYFLDTPLLITLLILRYKNKKLYELYIVLPNIADQVIDYLFKEFFPLKQNDYVQARIIGYLISCSQNNEYSTENQDFLRLISPYINKAGEAKDLDRYDINSEIVKIAQNPRGSRSMVGGNYLKPTVESIELVHQINIGP